MLFGQTVLALTLIALAAFLIGVSKAGLGGGVGVIATPLVALVMPVPEAAALMLPILIGADIFAVRHYRRLASGRDLRLLLPASLLGVAAGALAFDVLAQQERSLKAGVGLLAVAFVAWRLLAPRITGELQGSAEPTRAWGWLLGALAGFGSTLAHAGGPPVTVYLLPRRLPRQVFVGTNAWFFFVLNLVKLVPYAFLGLLSMERLGLALAMLPVAWLGTWAGVGLNRAVDERLFTRIVTVILLVTGLQLLFDFDLATLVG